MKKFDITITVKELQPEELEGTDRRLASLASEATHTSYSPYSRFSVGAAILLDNGEIVTGSNQENAATPSSLCAERTAAFYAPARYPEARFVAIAIAARDTTGKPLSQPISPCGACRQALLEFETLAGHDVRVILVGSSKCYIFPSVASTLPFCFTNFE